MKFIRNTRISSGGGLLRTGSIAHLTNEKLEKSIIFWGGFLSSKLHESFWIWWITTRQVISKKGLEPSPKPNPKYIPPLGLSIRSNQPGHIGLGDKWPSSQQNIFLWFFPFSQTHLVGNLFLLHVVKCLRGHRINNSLTFLAEYYISTTTSANYLGKYTVL